MVFVTWVVKLFRRQEEKKGCLRFLAREYGSDCVESSNLSKRVVGGRLIEQEPGGEFSFSVIRVPSCGSLGFCSGKVTV